MNGIVWLASYPKSGNTWVRILLSNYLGDRATPADIHNLETGPIASARNLFDEAVGLPASDLIPAQVERLRPRVYEQLAAKSRCTLYVKIHDAFILSAEGVPTVSAQATAGVLYLVRNPLDVAVSFGFHSGAAPGDMVARMNDPAFTLDGATDCLPRQLPQRLLTWSGHVRSWLDDSGLPVHIVRYEDLVRSPFATVTGLLAFAGLDPEPRRVARAIGFSGFETLQAQEASHGFREKPATADRFFRKGRVGDWRNHLSEDLAQRIVADHGVMMRRLGYLTDGGEIVF